jgi:hypothetical protein
MQAQEEDTLNIRENSSENKYSKHSESNSTGKHLLIHSFSKIK